MSGLDNWRLQAPTPAPLAPGQSHFFFSYASDEHARAVRCHDMLSSLHFRVFLDFYRVDDRETQLDKIHASPQWSNSVYKILVWSQRHGGQAAPELETAATHAKAAGYDCVISIGSERTADAFTRESLFTIVGDDESRGPKWQEIASVLAESGTTESGVSREFIALAAEVDESIDALRQRIQESQEPELLAGSDELPVLCTPYVACEIANRLISQQRYYKATHVLDGFATRFPDSVRVRQLQGLAYRRLENWEQAQAVLEDLRQSGWRDPETLGILAASWMKRYEKTKNPDDLERSRDLYAEAFDLTPSDTYVGLNAAAKSVLLGDATAAARYTDRVDALLQEMAPDNTYWDLATRAEVALLRKDYDRAAEQYALAVRCGGVGDHETTWLQAQRLLEKQGASADDRAKLAAIFKHFGPKLDLAEEVRLAIVMYGGVSLAIYINGVSQELLHLVRSTAPVEGTRQSALPQVMLRGTECVYRELAQLMAGDSHVGESSPIRARFVIDVLSGTSAGGINSVFLAKALVNDEKMDLIKQLWINDADMSLLVNDAGDDTPASLLDSRYMYRKLIEALGGMKRQHDEVKLACANELDLFVTATDIHGLNVAVPLADRVITEKRHRNVFHFRLDKRPGARNDFQPEDVPFLAFAARCTSAFPFAFEPMTLASIAGESDQEPGTDRWKRFYQDYIDAGADVDAAQEQFLHRPFGDGGYLDNKPFSHAIRSLSDRRVDTAAVRKLIYIEPAPREASKGPIGQVNAIENVLAALVTLPRYETIRQDLVEVDRRNRLVRHVVRATNGLEDDVRAWQHKTGPGFADYRDKKVTGAEGKDWSRLDLDEMIQRKGVTYGGYHRMKIALLRDEIAHMVLATAGFRARSHESMAIQYLVRAWADANYVESNPGQAQATQNKLLIEFDLAYRIRRLRLGLGKIDTLTRDPIAAQHAVNEIGGLSGDLSLEQQDELRLAWAILKPSLNSVLQTLDDLRAQLLQRPPLVGAEEAGRSNPLRAVFEDPDLSQGLVELMQVLPEIAEQQTEKERCHWAQEQLGNHGPTIGKVAVGLAEILRPTLVRASADCKMLFGADATKTGQLSDIERVARKVLWHYYHFYEDYDQIVLPSSVQTEVGEATEVDVVRISPADVASEDAMEKLAGTKYYAFAGFLKKSWRANDVLWGRLHAAERILTTFLPKDLPEYKKIYRRLLEQAYDAIIDEEFVLDGKRGVAQLLAEAVQNSENGAVKQQDRQALQTQLEAPQTQKANLQQDEFREYVLQEHQVDQKLEAETTVRLAGRSMRVLGKMMTGLSEGYGHESRTAAWLARAGLWLTGLAEVSIPGTVSRLLFRHWLAMIYVFELALFVGGAILMNGTIQRFAWQAFLITAAIHLATVLLRDYMGQWKTGKVVTRLLLLAKIIGVILILGFAGVGIYVTWQYCRTASSEVVGWARFLTTRTAMVGLAGVIAWRSLSPWTKQRCTVGRGTLAVLITIALSAAFVGLAFLAANLLRS